MTAYLAVVGPPIKVVGGLEVACVVGVAKPGCKPLQVELCEELTELGISKRNGGSRDGARQNYQPSN